MTMKGHMGTGEGAPWNGAPAASVTTRILSSINAGGDGVLRKYSYDVFL